MAKAKAKVEVNEEETAVVTTAKPLRPSDVAAQAKAAGYSDTFRFLKDNGLPNPKRLVRVTCVAEDLRAKYPAREFEADDTSDAICRFHAGYGIKPHESEKIIVHATVLEE